MLCFSAASFKTFRNVAQLKNGPIVIIEDDEDDQELLREVFSELEISNELLFFSNGRLALEYLHLREVYPFIILSDINMPELTGVELRRQVFENKQLSDKCIPYLFLQPLLIGNPSQKPIRSPNKFFSRNQILPRN